MPEELIYLTCDPQTSGGLLMCVPEEKVNLLLAELKKKGVIGAVVGRIESVSAGKIILRNSNEKIVSGRKSWAMAEGKMSQAEEKSSKARSSCCPGGPPAEELLAEPEKKEAIASASSSELDLTATPSGEKFIQFIQEAMKPGVLSLREKELVALSLAAYSRCEPCFKAHLEKAREFGLGQEEIKEALSLAVMFGGATVLMFIEDMQEKISL